ncbi:MAG: hypothetical protein GX446_13880 [Chthonomonadales bacterium]|nr:hypothetical protein [Chthonomonadales bacterium]
MNDKQVPARSGMHARTEPNLTELMPAAARVERLRERALKHAHEPMPLFDEIELLTARSWLASAGEPDHMVRRGMLAGDVLRNVTPRIDDDELLVGKFSCRPLTEDERAEVEVWRRVGAPALSRAEGQRAHMAVDYERVLRLGVKGVRELIARYRARLDLSRAEDLEADHFYRGCLAALDGLVALANRYADRAEEMARSEQDAGRRAELLEIAAICRRVPEHPAETFREAVQSVHFVTWALCAGNRFLLMQLGRPDRYLWPYYERDISSGVLTREEAVELLDCLAIMLNEYTPRGLAVGWMVGGRDETGRDVTNELTYLMLQTIDHVRMAYPGIGLCWNPDTPGELMDLACRLLARGRSHPALFADDVITRGLLQLGLPHRDACQYIHSTCVEITPIAISNVYVASPYYNLVQALHDVLGVPPVGGSHGVEPVPQPPTFDALMEAWKARIGAMVAEGVAEQNRAMMSRVHNGGFPLLSCFVNDCLARGKDIDRGGARANWIESSFVGLANLVDSLAAIRELVYERKTMSFDQLRAGLASNFEGHPDLQAAIQRTPKYGNDDDRADEIAVRVTEYLLEVCERHRSYWGDAVVPGFFCWIMHEHLGRMTLASCDGRPAGFPLADGSGPAQGRERQGPTAMVRSVTKWNHAPMIGGIAVNMRFQPRPDPDELAATMRPVLETFLKLGGFEAQVNVVGADILRDAQAHPERHRDLVVRIAGYSDYFVGLSPEMQAEVIARAELA